MSKPRFDIAGKVTPSPHFGWRLGAILFALGVFWDDFGCFLLTLGVSLVTVYLQENKYVRSGGSEPGVFCHVFLCVS